MKIAKLLPLIISLFLLTFYSFIQVDRLEVLHSQQAFPIHDVEEHAMGKSLFAYMDMKIHHLLKEREFENIWVVGDSDRSSGVSIYEKKGKLFNWQRPTAEIRGNDLVLRAFPGRAYVQHYATLIATYLAVQQKKWSHVRYILPDEATAWKALLSSNLTEVPAGDVAIIGYGLEQLIGDKKILWEGDGAFSWVKKRIANKTVVFVGGRHSYWGDIGGRVMTLLAKKGFKQVIYVGKVGGMNREGIPNQTLATGDSSFVEGEMIRWRNLFDFAKGDKAVVFGKHYTIPSVLNETKTWLENNQNYAFVDNEIGFMAKAALSESIGFSYLHIISDNLHGGYEEDLTNERGIESRQHRARLLEKAKALIEQGLEERTVRAAIDFGSGSVKIQVALANEPLADEPLLKKTIPLSLSEDVVAHGGCISEEMKSKAQTILKTFKEEALAAASSRGYSQVEFSGIATAVFRKAENGKVLLQQFENTLGIPFRIISQDEEGKVGFLAAKQLFPEVPENDLLVWDSGNGSYQFTAKEGNRYHIYRGPLGHGTVRVLLSQEIRFGPILAAHESGNPVQRDEAAKTAQKICEMLPEIPQWLRNKLKSDKTVVVTLGDGESIFAVGARAISGHTQDEAFINETGIQNVLEDCVEKDDSFFDAAGLNRKTLTSALLLHTVMRHFGISMIHFKSATGNTSGMLIMPELWNEAKSL